MSRVVKLSIDGLKKLIAEQRKLMKHDDCVSKVAKKTKEVEAEDLADTLENPIDYLKVQKIKEAKLLSKLKSVREEIKRVSAQKKK